MTLKEANEKFARLSERERKMYEKVMEAVKAVAASVPPGVTVTREMVREYMETASMGTISKYMSLHEALSRPEPTPDADMNEKTDVPQLSPVVATGFADVVAALDKLAAVVRSDTNATLAQEDERFRTALMSQKHQHDEQAQAAAEQLNAIQAERDVIAAEADALAGEIEDLRTALGSATERTNVLMREVELGSVMLRSVEGQLASYESKTNEARLDCVTANERADKAEAAREEAVQRRADDAERHQSSLDEALQRHQASLEAMMLRHEAALEELRQRHAAEIGEIRAAWAADIARERDRVAALDLAIISALKGAVDSGSLLADREVGQ